MRTNCFAMFRNFLFTNVMYGVCIGPSEEEALSSFVTAAGTAAAAPGVSFSPATIASAEGATTTASAFPVTAAAAALPFFLPGIFVPLRVVVFPKYFFNTMDVERGVRWEEGS